MVVSKLSDLLNLIHQCHCREIRVTHRLSRLYTPWSGIRCRISSFVLGYMVGNLFFCIAGISNGCIDEIWIEQPINGANCWWNFDVLTRHFLKVPIPCVSWGVKEIHMRYNAQNIRLTLYGMKVELICSICIRYVCMHIRLLCICNIRHACILD